MDETLVTYTWRFLLSGGPVMLALFVLSLFLYKNVVGLLLFVLRTPVIRVNASPRLVPADATIAELERRVYEEVCRRFRRLVQNRLRFTHALIIAAPLLGLLGTVMGMLHSFHGLSLQAGHETARLVADGVSRALVTTQTGLTIAIPALFLTQWIQRCTKKQEQKLLQEHVLHL